MSQASISPAHLRDFLQGLEFPADCANIARQAQQNGADDETVRTLASLRKGEFHSVAELAKAFSERND